MDFSFSVQMKDSRSRARAGLLRTGHGTVNTPAFMPVGTYGAVKSLSPDDLRSTGTQIILTNTYHLYLRPGDEVIRRLGGIHEFMGWHGPILTDSGGYQVSSLGHMADSGRRGSVSLECKRDSFKPPEIDDRGVTFFSHLDGTRHRFTPERSIEIQEHLGSDIIMAFDEATPARGKRYARAAMERTHAWLVGCKRRWLELEDAKRDRISHEETGPRRPQVLFGIIQGGNYRDLRRASAEFVVSKDLPGIAIGGASIGKNPEETAENVSWVADLLHSNKPLYLMGVGVNPEDVIGAVECGADLFDCVAPTRLARMGHLYNGKLWGKAGKWGFSSQFPRGRLNIDQARFRLDDHTIDEGCDCYTCTSGFSRAYLHHLFRSRELLYYRLASLHNVRFMVRLTEALRKDIVQRAQRRKFSKYHAL